MISTEVRKVSNCKKELNIVMPEKDVAQIREKETIKITKNVQLPGFRKGKAPKAMVLRSYAYQIEQNTMDNAVQMALREATEQENINIIGAPQLTSFDYDDDKNLVMKFEVEVFPEIELKKYKGLSLIKDIYRVSDKEVEKTIDSVLRQHATVKSIDGPAKEGNNLILILQELDENNLPIVGKKYEDMKVKLGNGEFDQELEQQLFGVRVNEERIVQKKYPDNYPQKEFAGKTEKYKIIVKKIEEETLPELDDEFVKEINEKFENVDSFKKQIKDNLETESREQSNQKLYRDLAHELLQENPFDIPEAMIENYMNYIIEDIRKKDPKVDEEAVRKNYHSDAVYNLKWMYFREKIAEKENLKVESTDLDDYLKNFYDENVIKQLKENKEVLKRIENDVKEKKILDFLLDNQKIKEKKVNT